MGSAASAVSCEGVLHEFSTLPDVLEDRPPIIILNLKQIRFKQFSPEVQNLRIVKNGPGAVTAR